MNTQTEAFLKILKRQSSDDNQKEHILNFKTPQT